VRGPANALPDDADTHRRMVGDIAARIAVTVPSRCGFDPIKRPSIAPIVLMKTVFIRGCGTISPRLTTTLSPEAPLINFNFFLELVRGLR
jgi:hypothetical protein